KRLGESHFRLPGRSAERKPSPIPRKLPSKTRFVKKERYTTFSPSHRIRASSKKSIRKLSRTSLTRLSLTRVVESFGSVIVRPCGVGISSAGGFPPEVKDETSLALRWTWMQPIRYIVPTETTPLPTSLEFAGTKW